jgi:hypothetical protein
MLCLPFSFSAHLTYSETPNFTHVVEKSWKLLTIVIYQYITFSHLIKLIIENEIKTQPGLKHTSA